MLLFLCFFFGLTSIMVPAHNYVSDFVRLFDSEIVFLFFQCNLFFHYYFFHLVFCFCLFVHRVQLLLPLSSIQNEISRKRHAQTARLRTQHTHTHAHAHTLNINQNERPKTNNKKIARFGHFHWPEAVCNGCKPARQLPIRSTVLVLFLYDCVRSASTTHWSGGNSKIGFSTILIGRML